PDRWVEAILREITCDGGRAGARAPEEMLNDLQEQLCDWPRLLGPVETFAGRPLRLADYDAPGGPWTAFRQLAGLPATLPAPDAALRRYPTPPGDQVRAARLVNALVSDPD